MFICSEQINVEHRNADGILKTVVQGVKTVEWPQEADPSDRKLGTVIRLRKSKAGCGLYTVLHEHQLCWMFYQLKYERFNLQLIIYVFIFPSVLLHLCAVPECYLLSYSTTFLCIFSPKRWDKN